MFAVSNWSNNEDMLDGSSFDRTFVSKYSISLLSSHKSSEDDEDDEDDEDEEDALSIFLFSFCFLFLVVGGRS